jgi:hypothetical protein
MPLVEEIFPLLFINRLGQIREPSEKARVSMTGFVIEPGRRGCLFVCPFVARMRMQLRHPELAQYKEAYHINLLRSIYIYCKSAYHIILPHSFIQSKSLL